MISPDSFLQDIAGLGGPDKGLGGLVMHGDIFLDGCVEFRDTAKYTTAQPPGSDVAEEALHARQKR